MTGVQTCALPIYCCFDVKVTKMVHEFGVTNQELFYTDKFNRRQKMAIDWQ